jgi:signal transduction histidine kinase
MMEQPDDVRAKWKLFLQLVLVAAAYATTARLGLGIDAVGGFATVVWPASGIALAAILLGGFRMWPAIWVGAFIANILTGAPLPAAAGIGIGNTAEAIAGAWLIQSLPGFRVQLDRVRDVLALMILAAGLSPILAASTGVATLHLAGIMPRAEVADAWKAWWIGDAIGALVIAPFLLAWTRFNPRQHTSRIAESAALAIVITTLGFVIFAGAPPVGSVVRGREYLIFPPLIWASLRFGTRGAVTSTAIAAIIAVVYTVSGRGPFVRGELHDNLLALQLFVGVTSATFLLLGASIAERVRTANDLEVAREVAESANKAKANFLGVVSHELRTPLNAIMGYVDLLMMQIDGALTQKQRDILERVRLSQRHLLSLIEDVLGFAQVEAGRFSLTLQPVNVRDTFLSVEQLVCQEAAKKSIALQVGDIDPSLAVTADADKLRQVMLNLVSNAVKFTSSGGTIDLTARKDSIEAVMNVRDTGIGIARENLNRVFDPFYQVDQGGTRKYPGVGLGLSIVRDAVLAMNGRVEITSEPGKGTDVSITLPLSNAGA